MKQIRASDIQCVADESGAKDYEFESPDARQVVLVRSHSKEVAEASAQAFFKLREQAEQEHPELFPT